MTIEEQLKEALRSVQRDNIHRMNRLRVFGVAGFAVISAIAAYLLDSRDLQWKTGWTTMLMGTSAYALMAMILYLGSRLYRGFRQVSRWAVPLVDIPIIVALQYIQIEDSTNKEAIAQFTLSVLVCCSLLSAFTLDLRQLGIAIGVAAAGQMFVGFAGGVSMAGQMAALVVFALVGWICLFAGRNRVELLTRITRANARRARLQRYFSPGVAELLEKQEDDMLCEGSECELTVVFTDIRGFTRLSEALESRDIIHFLNLYHARMVQAVFEHGGTLDKYLGDGLMIYFNAPVQQNDHALRAVKCAMAMKREIAAINTERSWHGEDQLRIGIGIHSGQAVLGDIGAPHRREFTAIGDTVNLASRIEELTKEVGHDVLVSQATFEQVRDDFAWTSIGSVPVPGRKEPVEVYAPGISFQPER
ncbi:adenylate/guanylatecyclase [Haloferula helveola]|uniref:Adenylate/guanylatecyclase n=1 Tax=Haloferula helveola TaxID=490095 RepID=A0ABN6H4C2_9BACT|nr:adenylate/guanylatecyclase [Haloferula helveola]